jgi:uncharacterized membrane-anchored protein
MQSIHNPFINLRYWVLICLVSIFGTNTGDIAVKWYKQATEVFGIPFFLGFKHLGPFPILLLLFALVYIFEKFDQRKIEVYFWAAIVLIRTAATNIADTLDEVQMPFWISVIIFSIVLLIGAIVWQKRRPKPIIISFVPDTNFFYWGMMFCAGILGTLVGDEVWHLVGLGTSSLVLSLMMAVLVFAGYKNFLVVTSFYWFGIVFARIAGTAVGDWLAKSVERGGVGLGLPLATLCSGIFFILIAYVWKSEPKLVEVN